MSEERKSKSGFAEVNGGKLYYEVAGEGHALVLIHEGITDSRMWDDQFDVFAQHYKVIRYDIRGWGNSDLPTESISFHEDLHSLLNFLNVKKAYVLGMSVGGSIAINFTLIHPEMVVALVLVAAGLGGYEFSKENNALSDEIDAAAERGDIAQAVELENRMWVDGPERTPDQVNPVVRERVREMNTHNYMLVLGKDLPAPQRLDPPAIYRLAEIQVPTLVIIGDKDVRDMIVIADKLEEDIPGAKKVIMRGVAHVPNMEKPEEFNRIVLDFLA